MCLALAALLLQIVAAARPPYSAVSFALGLPMLLLSGFVNWLAFVFMVMAHYCESNCHDSPLDRPTALIAAGAIALDLLVVWLAWRLIPRRLAAGKLA